MPIHKNLRVIVAAGAIALLPAPALAQVSFGIGFDIGNVSVSVTNAPPPIPEYVQPYVPAPDEIWVPGYWAWGQDGYYWVPGTWTYAPQPGYLWTPGYWAANNGGYTWNPGYWATSVGYYGGVNYGAGYYGRGYDGCRWNGNTVQYNSYVTRVNNTFGGNVYVDRNVYVNNSATRIAYSGGRNGLHVRPTEQEIAVERGHHIGMTQEQRQHARIASQDRSMLARVNHNRPAVVAVERPFSDRNRPAGYAPVKSSDRVAIAPREGVERRNSSAEYRAPAAHGAVPAYRAPRRAGSVDHAIRHSAPVHAAPAYHAPQRAGSVNHAIRQSAPVHAAPAYHAPQRVGPVNHAVPRTAPMHVAPAYHAPQRMGPVNHAMQHAAPMHAAPRNLSRAPAAHAPAPREKK